MEDSIRNNKGQYKKGYSYKDVPIEIRMKIIEKNKEAWRNKPEYIGDIVAKYPKIHNVWRGILYTKKGIKAGHSKEWENFKVFFCDVINTYKPGLLFRRLDSTKPFSKDNFIWVTKEEAQLLKSNLVWLEYNGEKLPLKDWADKTGNSLYGIKNRYYNREKHNYTIEEVIFGRKVKRGSKKVTHDNVSRAKASKMISAYKIIDKKNGYEVCDFDIDWMLENIVNKPCIYCGDTLKVGCDRIDNNKGHIKCNVVPCCHTCNCARNINFTYEEMFILGKTIAQIKELRNKGEEIKIIIE